MKKIALALALTASLIGNAHAHGGYRGAPGWWAVGAGVVLGAALVGAPVYAAPPVYVAPPQPVYQQPVYPQTVYQQPVYPQTQGCPYGTYPSYTNVTTYDAYGRAYIQYQLTCR